WQSYTNFVAMNLSTQQPEQMNIQVKFQSPGKQAGDPIAIHIDQLSRLEPVYALAGLSTNKPVRSQAEIVIQPALGIKVEPTASNPVNPVRVGNSNTFRVTENGYYSFDLTDVTDPDRKDTLFIVVSNIDNVAPRGDIELLTVGYTNKNVQVK